MSLLLLSDDLVLTILTKLDPDPRDWARTACASSRLAALVHFLRSHSRLARSLPPLLASSLSLPHLHTLSVCCPGLRRSGVLLHHSDFGLLLDIGPDRIGNLKLSPTPEQPSSSSDPDPDPSWSLFDDLYLDTLYDPSESHLPHTIDADPDTIEYNKTGNADADLDTIEYNKTGNADADPDTIEYNETGNEAKRKREWLGPVGAHLATGAWTLSREQGNKLLASRFRGDCLYICDWPGCVHAEEKRIYMVFRGVFLNFKRSRVWRTINDGNRNKIGLQCVFCECKETWDLHSAFCLRRVFGFHDDGEPVVRAYVCENGHVAGAWTERPMYT